MGGQLSFILLCIINSFVIQGLKYKNSPYLINGDDHLFIIRKKDLPQYEDWVRRVGFRLNKEKTLISRSFACLNSTLIRMGSGTSCKFRIYRHLNTAFLSPFVGKDHSSLAARFEYLMKVVGINDARVKAIFVTRNKKELQRASLHGLLAHDLLPEEGGLGILTPAEASLGTHKKDKRLTKSQILLRNALYTSASNNDDPIPHEIYNHVASMKTFVCERRKPSAVVYSDRRLEIVSRASKQSIRDLSSTSVMIPTMFVFKVEKFSTKMNHIEKVFRTKIRSLKNASRRQDFTIRKFWLRNTIAYV